jgi:hypothetical protein
VLVGICRVHLHAAGIFYERLDPECIGSQRYGETGMKALSRLNLFENLPENAAREP